MTENMDPTWIGGGIYREHILDYFKNPRNFGSIAKPDISYHDHNPVCGDEITMELKLDNGRVSEVKFRGKGCAISQSSASMLTEHLEGKSLEEIKKIEKEQVLKNLAIPIGPVRMKCALLSLSALKKGIFMYEKRRLEEENEIGS